MPKQKENKYDKLSDKELIDAMAEVMAGSIAKLLQSCIEIRCKQFLNLMHEKGAL